MPTKIKYDTDMFYLHGGMEAAVVYHDYANIICLRLLDAGLDKDKDGPGAPARILNLVFFGPFEGVQIEWPNVPEALTAAKGLTQWYHDASYPQSERAVFEFTEWLVDLWMARYRPEPPDHGIGTETKPRK